MAIWRPIPRDAPIIRATCCFWDILRALVSLWFGYVGECRVGGRLTSWISVVIYFGFCDYWNAEL
jgi:hypothetical protein